MVFESIVVDILNRLLGDYFENLDTSQLKLGIWGGDVVLRELLLKHSAMDDLGLPFKVVVGKVGTLRMKIPWQNLYTAPVELNLQNLFLLVTPSYSVKYNEEAEEKALQVAKQKEITRLDEARTRERLKKLEGTETNIQEDTFSEKLITQIIKNVQIRIDCIHVRYEDSVTKPLSPFGFGLVLKSLYIETTDEEWKPTVITETVETINKMATLNGLSLYWNSKTKLVQQESTKLEMIAALKDLVDNENNSLTYVLGPIASVAKVLLTPNPERLAEPFSKPKFWIDVVMEQLALGLTDLQFQDIMELAEALDFMTRAQHYRKYRPNVSVHKEHYKDWWKFAYRCIVEEEVRRKHQNWDWHHIKRHRNLCRTYADAYYKKLTMKKLKAETTQALQHCEKELDVFNITLVRKRVEVNIEREGKRNQAIAQAQTGGWFSGWTGWFGGEKENAVPTDNTIGDIVHKIGEALTPEEKAKLYEAIDYSENTLPLDYPDAYEEYFLNFLLNKLVVTVRDSLGHAHKGHQILNLEILKVETTCATRPVKNGLKVEVFMGGLEAEGLKGKQDPVGVKIVTSKTMHGFSHLFEVLFESNPLNSQVNQRIKIQAQPVEVLYHGKTVIQLAKCFALPPEMQLSKLQAAAMSTFNEWREQSASGLQHLIETRGEIDIDIHLVAPYFLVPQDGKLSPKSSVLVVDLGELKLKSKPRKKRSGQDAMLNLGKSFEHEAEYVTAMKKVAYDSMIIELTDFQVFIALPGEDYAPAKDKLFAENERPQTLIKSSKLLLQLDQSLIPDDPRFARLQLEGSLPLLDLDITEHRLLELVRLLVTLPFPQGGDAPSTEIPPTLSTIAEDPSVAESYAISKITYEDSRPTDKDKPIIEFIELLIRFTIDSIKIRVTRVNSVRLHVPFVDFELNHLQAKLTNKTFSSGIDIAIGGLTMCALQNKILNEEGPLYLLRTPIGVDRHLFKMHMFSIFPNCPIKLAGKVKQLIKVDVSSLDVTLHHEALKAFMSFGDEIVQALSIATTTNESPNSDSMSMDSISISSTTSNLKPKRRLSKQLSRIEATRRAVAKKHTNFDDILLQIDAKMESFTVQISSENKNLIKAVLQHMDFSMIQKTGKTVMVMELVDLGVRNLDPNTIYKDLIAVEADKTLSVKVTMHDDATKGKYYYDMNKHDMSVKIETGSPKIYYISRLVDEILAFIDNFAAAKEAVIDASTAAAAAARENVEQAYAAASRILLDINLNAPIVFVPRNEKSQQALLADLGRLTLRNKFTKEHIKDLSAYAIIDKMDIHLANMRVSRIQFDKNTQNLQSEVLLMEPVNFKLSMHRNLSSDWYHGIPDFTLNGTLWNAYIRASQEDYEIVMATLMENIAYTSDTLPPPSSSSVPGSKAIEAKKRKPNQTPVLAEKVQSGASLQTIVSSASSTDSSVYTKMEININVPELRVIMYQKGAVKLDQAQGTVERNELTAFADFVIKNVRMDMKSWSNGNMICPIVLDEINLRDVRPGNRIVTNLIQRKLNLDSNETSIAKFSFKKDVANKLGTTLILETTSLTIVLCLDYLLQILDFFSKSETAPSDYPKPDLTMKYEKHSVTADPVPVREVTADKPQVTVGLELDPESEPFSGYYNFSETEIILVESMDTVQSNALLLHCEVSFKQLEVDGRSNMMGTIGNVKLSTCNYDPDNRHRSVAEVLSPMSVTVVMNHSEAVGTLIDVNISDILIRLTAGTLELLLKIVSTVGASSDPLATGVVEKDYSDLWDIKKNEDMNFWFLNPDASVEVGLEALQVQEDKARLFNVAEELKVSERLVMESGCIVFTFETGVGNNTMPMLLIETDIDLQMFDWSTNMTVAGRMKLEAAYYNALFGMWEFIVEPVETRHHGKVAHQPWEMLFEYSSRINPVIPSASEDETASSSYMSVALESSDILELTVTRSALDVLDVIMDDFQAAAKKLVSEKAISTAAYCIVNDTGSDVKVLIKDKGQNGAFILIRDSVDYEEVLLKHGTRINLGLIESADMTKHHSSVLREQEGKEERLLMIEIPDYDFKKDIPVNRASKRYYSLKRNEQGNFGLICDTWVKDCSKIVTLRGIVQIVNDLQVDVDVYYKEDSGKTAKLAGTAIAGQKYNLPVPCTYTKSGELFFAPAGFSISTESFSWTSALKELEKIVELKCKSQKDKETFFFMKVIGEAKQALHESTNRKNLASQCCYIYLESPLLIDNLLPVSLGYSANPNDEVQIVEHGTTIYVTNIRAGLDGNCKLTLRIPEYNKMTWTCNVVMDQNTPDISQWVFVSEQDPQKIMALGIHKELEDNEVTWHVYVPYWMINRTGLDLVYRGDEKQSQQTLHPRDQDIPVALSFPGKAFFSKKGAFVKVQDINLPAVGSDWSEKFSLDVAGSAGSVTCKSPMQSFHIGVEIQLSSWGLTKYVIFTPRYFLVNQCPFDVYVREADRDLEIQVQANSCVSFWPKSAVAHLKAAILTEDGKKHHTKEFKYDCVRHTLLQLQNKYGGVHVDIHYSEAKTVITFSDFIPGQAPVLLVNGTTDCPIEISEEGLDNVFILLPRMCQMFTWKEPLGERILHWSAIGTETKKPQGTDRLFSDGFGAFYCLNEDDEKEYYWISFLDGLQRVLLFTPDLELATYLQAARENEVATAEYIVMLHGIGISLVDNEKAKEIMYMRIASSEISWESCKPGKKKRYKPLKLLDSKTIELAYQNYLNQRAISSNVKSNVNLDSGIQVDFITMKINKPSEKNLRRVFQTGIWLHYKTLPNSSQFHAKINRLQIDNQLHDSVFRVVFAPVPPPKSVTAVDMPKPFAEVSIMQRVNAHNYVQQYKYFKILVQEFHIRLDIGFVNGLVEMFSGSTASKQENMLAKFTKEFEEACLSSNDVLARQIVSQGQKNFYDFLHFSPLKIHVSFSMGGSAQLSNHLLNLVLASVGVTLTEVNDVLFKLSCLELQHSFLSGDQLYNEVYSHYSSQAIKQLYVLVLGLDVLGNPYGLALGVASGVEAFFYEPFQGAIQGPGEFAEGLALGMKTLLGSTVGGAAGAFSRITGTLGKGIAALTMDDDFQKKRRDNMHHHGDAAEGLARSGKGLVMGFVDGISGFVTKPFRGARDDGVGGFFKGVGKGTIGLVARPAAGVIDFASGSFDAVKKCTTISDDVHRMRPPRCIPLDTVLQPYVLHEAEGVHLIKDLEKGRYAKTDSYLAHALINPHGIYVLLLTNKRLFYLKRDELFGGWGTDWSYMWEDFSSPPDLVEKGILFRLKNPPHKKMKMFRSVASKEFVVPINSAEVCTVRFRQGLWCPTPFWLLSKIEEAMKSETGMVFTDGIEAAEYVFA